MLEQVPHCSYASGCNEYIKLIMWSSPISGAQTKQTDAQANSRVGPGLAMLLV